MVQLKLYQILLLIVIVAVLIWYFISNGGLDRKSSTMDLKLEEQEFEAWNFGNYKIWPASSWKNDDSTIEDTDRKKSAQKHAQSRYPTTNISILTFNIWLSKFEMKKRMDGLGKIIKELNPNIVSLNEVTKENLAMLQKEDWFTRYKLLPSGDIYQMMPPDLAKEDVHTVTLLSGFPVKAWKIFPYADSPSGRKLLRVDVQIPFVIRGSKSTMVTSVKTLPFTFAATHLEWKKENAKRRENQLNKAVQMLSPLRNSCIMGDMNVRQADDGKIILPKPWQDAWLSIPGNTNGNGYTWDLTKNSMNKRKTSRNARFDRVICKLADFKVHSMEIVGTQPLAPGVYPSDHLGLFTVLALHKTEESMSITTKADGGVVFSKEQKGD